MAPRITNDSLFAPAPHELITDPNVSPPAFRLWCILHKRAWMREPPDVPELAKDMAQAGQAPPTRRSIYRWLGELESAGWLGWAKCPGKAGQNDRFELFTTRRQPVTAESQLGQPVTLGSQPVIVESQVVTIGSQVGPIYPLPERVNLATQNHEIHESHGGGGGSPPPAESPGPAPAAPAPAGAELQPMIELFASYGIGAAELLANKYRAHWPATSLAELAELCAQLYDPSAGKNAPGRLYRRLSAGPIGPREGAPNEKPRSPNGANRAERSGPRAGRGPDEIRAGVKLARRDW